MRLLCRIIFDQLYYGITNMNIEELRAQWEIDCNIDTNDLSAESARQPNLHSKYLNELITYRLRITKLQNDMINYRIKRTKYYRGEMTKQELDDNGWSQWQYKTLKSEVDNLIEADQEYQLLVTRESYIKTAIYMLESILSEIKSRSFTIKNAIEWTKFRAGA